MWEWHVRSPQPEHTDRYAFMRIIPYALSGEQEPLGNGTRTRSVWERQALSINLSPGGMLLMMTEAPRQGQHMTISFPNSAGENSDPRTAEVRWTRPVPGDHDAHVHFVGIKFLR